jgi:hypothetical protein
MLDLLRHGAALATNSGAVVADEHCNVLHARLRLCHGRRAATRRLAGRLGEISGREPEHAMGADRV